MFLSYAEVSSTGYKQTIDKLPFNISSYLFMYMNKLKLNYTETLNKWSCSSSV